MKKKLTVLLSLVLTAALTIPVFAGTEPATIAAADTNGKYIVEVGGKDTGVKVAVMVLLGKMAKAMGMTVAKKGNDPQTVSMSGQKIQITTENQTRIPNPYVDYDTIEEAQKAVGFSVQLPTKVTGYEKDAISVMDGKVLQIVYRNGDAEICIRKAAGKDDISGVYESYTKVEKVTAGDVQAELRGDGTKVYVAVWTSGSYTYAVYASAGMTKADMTTLVQQVK